MASSDGEIRLKVGVDSSQVKSGLKTTESQVNSVTASMKKLGAAVVAAFSVRQIVKFGAEAVQVASDLIEVQNVVDVAFGNMSDKMEEFASKSITQFGMSELAAKQTGSSYMAMAVGLGMSRDAASDMSLALTGLSGDMASFYNISQEEAKTALASVFTGETETLKRYGILITETNLQEFARQQGISKSIVKMTQMEKVQLRYNYVMSQTALAQGDFARTSDSWANQARILTEQWKQFKSVIGAGLIQVLTPVLKLMNSLLQYLNAFGESFARTFNIQSSGNTATATQTSQIQDSVDAQNDLTDAVEETSEAEKGQIAGFDTIQKLSEKSKSSDNSEDSGLSSGAILTPSQSASASGGKINQTLENLKGYFAKFKADIETKYAPSLNAWRTAFAALKEPASKMFGSMKESATNLWKNSFLPLLSKIRNDFLPGIANKFSETVAPIFSDVMPFVMSEFALDFKFMCNSISSYINDIYSPALDRVKNIFCDTMDGIKLAWDKYGQELLVGFQEFKENLRNIFDEVYLIIIKPIADKVFVAIDKVWTEHLKPLWDELTLFFGSVANFIMSLLNNILLPIVSFLIEKVGPVVVWVGGVIINIISTIIGFAAKLAQGFLKALRGILDFFTLIFRGEFKKAFKGLGDDLSAWFKWFYVNVIERIAGAFANMWDSVKKGAAWTWYGIKAGAIGMVNFVIKCINTMLKGILAPLNLVIDGLNLIPGVDIKKLSLAIPEISMPSVPKLAQGAVIPPNREFMAVLGDQKHGTNIETPLETMIQAFKAAQEGNDGGNVTIPIYLDGEKIYENQGKIKARKGMKLSMGMGW